MKKIIYWCKRHKKVIPLEEQTDEGCMPCGHMCCCPDTIFDGSAVDEDSKYHCVIHDKGIDEYSDALDYCRDCGNCEQRKVIVSSIC